MKLWLIPIFCSLLFCGCSTTTGPRTALPWYEDINPMTDQTVSDWVLFDLDKSSYQRDPSAASELWEETVTTVW